MPLPVRERVEMMADEAARAARIVQNLLLFARHYPPERRPCAISDQVERVVALKAYQLERDKISVVTEFTPCPPVWADENKIQQVLLNLVQNAHQALVRQTNDRVLTLRVRRAGHACHRGIDNGPAFRPSSCRASSTRSSPPSPPGEGSGLGLSVSYGIVGQHGGRLYAENRPDGGGASFVVELPTGERS